MKKLILAGCLMGMTGLNGLADNWAVSVSFGGVFGHPAPVYRTPAPVVVAPQPVYMAPAPVMIAPAPVVVGPPVYLAPPPMMVYRPWPAYYPAPVCRPVAWVPPGHRPHHGGHGGHHW